MLVLLVPEKTIVALQKVLLWQKWWNFDRESKQTWLVTSLCIPLILTLYLWTAFDTDNHEQNTQTTGY